MATDSRFSFGTVKPPDDEGRKLYSLTPSAALVYAGDVTLAQRGVSAILRYLARRRRGSNLDPALDIGRILAALRRQEDDRLHQWRRPGRLSDIDPLFLLIGSCDREGHAVITRYATITSFNPITLLGVEAVGFQRDVDVFKAALRANEEERWTRNDIPVDPAAWQFDVVAAIRKTLINPGRTRTIGGKIQTLVITKDGAREINFAVTAGNPMDASAWTTVTVPMAEVHAHRASSSATAPEPEAGLMTEHVLD